ncbi:Pr6Pr family membrane protein [Microbacterium tumbae]
MRTQPAPGIDRVALLRLSIGVIALGVLCYAYALRIAAGDGSLFDYFGYFTNLTALLSAVVLLASGTLGGRTPLWIIYARGVATACMIVVGVIYNLLVPGTGSAPPWVSAILHVALPLTMLLDWTLVADRPPLRWRYLWIVLPYPILWLIVTLVRGVTDGWVPYGFLLPSRGALSLWLHVAGLLATLLLAAGIVWTLSRLRRPR